MHAWLGCDLNDFLYTPPNTGGRDLGQNRFAATAKSLVCFVNGNLTAPTAPLH